MDAVGLASRYVFVPVFDHFRGLLDAPVRREVARSQYYKDEQIRLNQWIRLQSLLRHVYLKSDFYRQRFTEMGARPEDLRSLEDFARLPILTKDDIRNNLQTMTCSGLKERDLLPKRTGGSTGVPLRLFQDRSCQVLKDALVRRHDGWAGFRLGEKRGALWHDDLWDPPKGLTRKIFSALALRTIFLDTINMDDASLAAFSQRLLKTGTRLLFGHGHSIYYFARYLRESHATVPRLDGIISSAETLPPEERRVVEEVFGNIVFDRYGCEEIGLIASECDVRDGMHTAAEGVYVEILGGSTTEPGRLIVTDLVNRGTPLIRYDIGDLATTKSGPCACGRGLPRIGRVTGRTSDILYSPEGKGVSGISLLDTAIIHIAGLKQAQIVQEELDQLVFNVVKDVGFSQATLDELSSTVLKYFGPRMRFTVNYVDSIALTGRGKFQFSVCKIRPPQRVT